MQTGAKTHQQYKYMPETDRAQVPWGIHEKNFGNIAIRIWNRYIIMDIKCDVCEIARGCWNAVTFDNVHINAHQYDTLCISFIYAAHCLKYKKCIYNFPQEHNRVNMYIPTAQSTTVYKLNMFEIHTFVAQLMIAVMYTLCEEFTTNSAAQHATVRPVLKHGPRSLIYMQVRNHDRIPHNRYDYPWIIMSCRQALLSEFEHKYIYKDPKYGELCQWRPKFEETQMDAHRDTDVQIVCLTLV